MAKGDRKVQSEDESSESDSEYESPSYDELVQLLNKYTKVIIKTRSENDKFEHENESLLAKLKSSDELRDQNEIMTTKLKKLKLSLKELKEHELMSILCIGLIIWIFSWDSMYFGCDALHVRLKL